MSDYKEIENIINKWFDDEIDNSWRTFCEYRNENISEKSLYDLENAHEYYKENLEFSHKSGQYGVIPTAVEKNISPALPSTSHRYALVAAQCKEAQWHIHDTYVHWSKGECDYRPTWQAKLDPAVFPSPRAETKAHPSPLASTILEKEGPTLKEAMEDWLEERKKRGAPSKKDIVQTRNHIQAFLDVVGSDTKVSSVTKRQAGEFCRATQMLPPRANQLDIFRDLNICQIAKKIKDEHLVFGKLNPRTVNSRIGDIKAMFDRQKKYGIISENPFEGMHEKEPSYRESEKPWSDKQLEKIFTSSIFMGCQSPVDIFSSGTFLLNDWRFWGFLIALTTGARVGEIAQLRPKDVIKVDDSIWVFNISKEGGRRVKTSSSIRIVPIHDELIRIGIIELSEYQKKNEKKTLLIDTPPPVSDSYSHYWTKFMSTQLCPKLEIDKTKGQGWHSFRHNFQDYNREAGILESITERLAGRVPSGVGGRYGKFKPKVLKEAIDKIKFPSFLKEIPKRY